MPELRLEGCRSRPLIRYLKALGLLRVVVRQADENARVRWAGGVLELSSSLDREQLGAFLLERYVPAPAVSAWNGGSGFFPKGNATAVAAVLAIERAQDPRLEPLRRALAIARQVLAGLGIEEKPDDRDVKLRLLRTLRAELPDDALEWLDAAVVILEADPAYPPLLGSGGNDGRFDFANNYVQAVPKALGIGAAANSQERAADWLAGSLEQAPTPLERMSIGHFLRDASPVNSPAGEADGLGNPWDLVLAVEGCLVLAAGAARRHDAAVERTLVAPFTVEATAAGYGSALAGEKGRAELWLPLWSRWASLRELETLVREARAQVGRRRARSGLDLIRSAGELGVARGLDAFERYAVLERAGQSSLAVPAGRVEVRPRPEAMAIRTIDRWLTRALRYARGRCPASHAQAISRLERALFAFAGHPVARAGGEALERLGDVERVLATAGALPDFAPPPIRGAGAGPWLAAADDGSAEFVIAASLASLRDDAGLPAIRDYLHGTKREPSGERVFGGGGPRTVPRRAAPVRRLAALHARRHLDAEGAQIARPRQGAPSLGFEQGLRCPLAAARLLAAGALDEARTMRLLEGLSLLDFRSVSAIPKWQPAVAPAQVPSFDILALAWAGTRDVPAQPRPGWAAQLAAGTETAIAAVLRDALLRLRMAGRVPLINADDLLAARLDGPRLAAALLLHLPQRDRALLARRLTHSQTTPEPELAQEGAAT